MSGPEWAMLLGLSVLWGGSFFFTRVALDAVAPFTLVALRVGLAALILNAVVPLAGLAMPRAARVWGAFLGMGLLNNAVPFCLIVWGQTQIASGLAAILNATTPLFTVVAAHLLTADERMTGHRIAGVLAGLAGVAVMVGPAVLAGLGTDLLAQVAVLGAALSYACAGLFGQRFRRMGVPHLATAASGPSAGSAFRPRCIEGGTSERLGRYRPPGIVHQRSGDVRASASAVRNPSVADRRSCRPSVGLLMRRKPTTVPGGFHTCPRPGKPCRKRTSPSHRPCPFRVL
jgi:hypothetical protein